MTSAHLPPRHDLVVVANGLPVGGTPGESGGMRPRDLASGAVAALRVAATARRATWIGWHGGVDTEVAPFPLDDLWLHPVSLSAGEVADHVRGECATTLAPLYHDGVQPAAFHRGWRAAYQAVNWRFAQTAARLAAPGGVVWVQDYHLQMVPGYLRRLRPDLLIGFLLHTPFPPVELFARLPERAQLVSGLLGADLIGFQQARSAENFLAVAREGLGMTTGEGCVEVGERRTPVGTFPIAVDAAEFERVARDPQVAIRAGGIRTDLNHPRTVFLAVSRLTPADGVEQILDAYAATLASRSLDPASTVLILVAGAAEEGGQQALRASVERRVGEINGCHAALGRPVVHYLSRHLDRGELVALYRAADVLLATPLRAGTSLVAKEFVASRVDDTGGLVLSEFAGAAADLPGALVVNPHNADALAAAMRAAARGAAAGLQSMRTMREQLRGADVHAWAGHYLTALGGSVAASYLPSGAGPHRLAQRPAVPPAGAGRRAVAGDPVPAAYAASPGR
jgi:trehalose 6-phosphate synthase